MSTIITLTSTTAPARTFEATIPGDFTLAKMESASAVVAALLGGDAADVYATSDPERRSASKSFKVVEV